MKILLALSFLLLVGCASPPLDTVVLIETNVATGSGVVIFSEYDYSVILTAKHVIFDAKEITVQTFPDKEKHVAVLLKSGKDSDLALLRIDKAYSAADVATPRYLKPMTKVVKVGAALGFEPFPTEGIVTHFHPNSVLTSTPIWFGDSGGGLFHNGKLVGIVSQIAVDRVEFFIFSLPLPVSHMAKSENTYAIWKFLNE